MIEYLMEGDRVLRGKLGHVLGHGRLAIQEYEALCPDCNRRTLSRPQSLGGQGIAGRAGNRADRLDQELLAGHRGEAVTCCDMLRQAAVTSCDGPLRRARGGSFGKVAVSAPEEGRCNEERGSVRQEDRDHRRAERVRQDHLRGAVPAPRGGMPRLHQRRPDRARPFAVRPGARGASGRQSGSARSLERSIAARASRSRPP